MAFLLHHIENRLRRADCARVEDEREQAEEESKRGL